MSIGLQVFKINPDGTTNEIKTEGAVKEVLEAAESYVIVADDVKKVYLWKGTTSSVRSKFIGAKRSQEIRGMVGMHFAVVPLDEGEEDEEFIRIIGGRTQGGIAKEIKEEPAASTVPPLREKSSLDSPRPAEGMNIAGSKQRGAMNQGPMYTGQQSPAAYAQDEQQVNFEQIMKKLEEIQIPQGYERELIIIGSYAYSVVEKVQTFLGQKKVEKVVEKVGSIPEGIFFAENYSPRVLSESGRIIAIEFLKRVDGAAPAKAPEFKDKKQILKDQIKIQLGGQK